MRKAGWFSDLHFAGGLNEPKRDPWGCEDFLKVMLSVRLLSLDAGNAVEARVALVIWDKALDLPEPWLHFLEKRIPFPAEVRTIPDVTHTSAQRIVGPQICFYYLFSPQPK